jgi:DNA-directed RNA polymerase subunit RPC12/RpoP
MRIRRAQPVPAGSRAGLDLRLGVACPRCGAPIWLDEGVAAAACATCGEGFLVLPRIDPFAAFVAATVGTDEARHIARAFLRSGRHRATWVGSGRWRLLPYWRCRARAFQWIAGRRGGSGEADEYHHLDVQSFDLLLPAAPDSPAGPPPRPGILEAYPMAPGALPGARPEPAALGPEAARTRAREEIERRSAPARTAISGRRLALVGEERMVLYLPFFSLDYRFRDEAREVLVDGLLGEVAAHGELAVAGVAAAGVAAAGSVGLGGAVLGAPSLFLPLRCPACSARLRFAPGDRVHGCNNCGRAWEVAGRRLCEVPQRLAASTRAPGACHLPFWVVRTVAPSTGSWMSSGSSPRLLPAASRIRRWCPALPARAPW